MRPALAIALLVCVACSKERRRAPAVLSPLAEPIVLSSSHVARGASRAPGKARRRLARLVHVTDVHITDDESPARVVDMDGPPPFSGASRAAESHLCRVLNAAVRTINRLHAEEKIDLVLFGGDNVDNAQQNELGWFLAIAEGKTPVSCDSGAPNDPVPGDGNDPKDPFVPEGLGPRWAWTTGNHDVLSQGVYAVDPGLRAKARGDRATGGTRDWSAARGPVTRGKVVADPARDLIDRERIVTRLGAHLPDGYARTRSVGTIDVGEVRLVVVDTAAETGGDAGIVRRPDLDAFIEPELARARADKKPVILAAHHPTDMLGDGSVFGGPKQPDALPRGEWEDKVAGKPVILSLVGHGHAHRVRQVKGTWEIMTSALADWPAQMRLVEIWDEDNGMLTIRAICIDFAVRGDPLAEQARTLMEGERHQRAAGEPADRDVILWTPRP
jgi:3',5'-cyclic AMP phosphodiesterase CpdA